VLLGVNPELVAISSSTLRLCGSSATVSITVNALPRLAVVVMVVASGTVKTVGAYE
jgi:hypothetical protein